MGDICEWETFAWRVPLFSIRDCAGTSKKRGPSWRKLSAIHVTEKTACDCMMLWGGYD